MVNTLTHSTVNRNTPQGVADWPWHRVLYELAERGWILAALERAHGLKHSALAKTKLRPNPSAQRLIASTIGLSPLAIWPSRYREDGQPVKRADWLRAQKPKGDLR